MARRLEIFRAVAPELERVGPRRLTMQRAAELASMSVGTLYTYFPSKRALVFYGLDPEPAALICRSLVIPRESRSDPATTTAAASAVIALIVATVRLMRASATAVMEAGPDAVQERLDAVVHQPVDEFSRLLEASGLGATADGGSLEPLIRRAIASALFEPGFDPIDLRDQLATLFRRSARMPR